MTAAPTLERDPSADRAAAVRELIRDAVAAAVLRLRDLLRSDHPRLAFRAADAILRLKMTLIRHRATARRTGATERAEAAASRRSNRAQFRCTAWNSSLIFIPKARQIR